MQSGLDDVITVEGVVEDIEVRRGTMVYAVQCKYHEAQSQFSLSIVYKPILMMMKHFCECRGRYFRYVLYGYFPGLPIGTYRLEKGDFEKIITTKNKDLKDYVRSVVGKINLDRFIDAFSFEIGDRLDVLSEKVQGEFVRHGCSEEDARYVWYPNAIYYISQLSMMHEDIARKTTKRELLGWLESIKKTIITKWIFASVSRSKILEVKKRQLRYGLSINSRSRCFVFSGDFIGKMSGNIVKFMKDFIDKYHCKPAHTKTPVFCVECDDEVFREIVLGVSERHVLVHDGMLAGVFGIERFLIDPIVKRGSSQAAFRRQFDAKICRLSDVKDHMLLIGADDYFCVGDVDVGELVHKSCSEILNVDNCEELSYLMGVGHVR